VPALNRNRTITITNNNRDLLCAPYKQNDGALHSHDYPTLPIILT